MFFHLPKPPIQKTSKREYRRKNWLEESRNKKVSFQDEDDFISIFNPIKSALKKAELCADTSNYSLVSQALESVIEKGNFSLSSSWQDTIRISTYYIPILIAQLLFFILAVLFVSFLFRCENS
jgi:hypothetical protein